MTEGWHAFCRAWFLQRFYCSVRRIAGIKSFRYRPSASPRLPVVEAHVSPRPAAGLHGRLARPRRLLVGTADERGWTQIHPFQTRITTLARIAAFYCEQRGNLTPSVIPDLIGNPPRGTSYKRQTTACKPRKTRTTRRKGKPHASKRRVCRAHRQVRSGLPSREKSTFRTGFFA